MLVVHPAHGLKLLTQLYRGGARWIHWPLSQSWWTTHQVSKDSVFKNKEEAKCKRFPGGHKKSVRTWKLGRVWPDGISGQDGAAASRGECLTAAVRTCIRSAQALDHQPCTRGRERSQEALQLPGRRLRVDAGRDGEEELLSLWRIQWYMIQAPRSAQALAGAATQMKLSGQLTQKDMKGGGDWREEERGVRLSCKLTVLMSETLKE